MVGRRLQPASDLKGSCPSCTPSPHIWSGRGVQGHRLFLHPPCAWPLPSFALPGRAQSVGEDRGDVAGVGHCAIHLAIRSSMHMQLQLRSHDHLAQWGPVSHHMLARHDPAHRQLGSRGWGRPLAMHVSTHRFLGSEKMQQARGQPGFAMWARNEH